VSAAVRERTVQRMRHHQSVPASSFRLDFGRQGLACATHRVRRPANLTASPENYQPSVDIARVRRMAREPSPGKTRYRSSLPNIMINDNFQSSAIPDIPQRRECPTATLDVRPHLRLGWPWELSRITAGAVRLPSPPEPRLLRMTEGIHAERTASEPQDRVSELIEQQTAISQVLRAIAS
jgi:hypothetical protein